MSNYCINERIYSTNVRSFNINGQAAESLITMFWHLAPGCRFVFYTCPPKTQRRPKPDDRIVFFNDSKTSAENNRHVRLHLTEGLGCKGVLTDPGVAAAVLDHLSRPQAKA